MTISMPRRPPTRDFVIDRRPASGLLATLLEEDRTW